MIGKMSDQSTWRLKYRSENVNDFSNEDEGVHIDDEPCKNSVVFGENSIGMTSLKTLTISDAGGETTILVKTTLCDNSEKYKKLKEAYIIHRGLDHQSIVRIFEIKQSNNSVVVSLERGIATLGDLLNPSATIELIEIREQLIGSLGLKGVFRQILDALVYLHKDSTGNGKAIAHRGINLESLIVFQNKRDKSLTIKLGDFDFAYEVCRGTKYHDADEIVYQDTNLFDKIAKGQEIDGKEYLAGDIISTGLVFHVLAFGTHLSFQGKFRPLIAEGRVDELAKNLIYSMIQDALLKHGNKFLHTSEDRHDFKDSYQ